MEKVDKELLKHLTEAYKDRFATVKISGSFSGMSIWIDRTTGVEYLSVEGWGNAFIPLIDADGKPLLNQKLKS